MHIPLPSPKWNGQSLHKIIQFGTNSWYFSLRQVCCKQMAELQTWIKIVEILGFSMYRSRVPLQHLELHYEASILRSSVLIGNPIFPPVASVIISKMSMNLFSSFAKKLQKEQQGIRLGFQM